jgi:3',5'-cyclic-AMP phosphodiesterase
MRERHIRIGVIADIHCGPDRDSLPGSRSPLLLDRFVDAMRELRPACIVDLGDRINSVSAGQDRVRERYVRRRLEDAGVPVYCVLGNTDVHRLTKDEALAAVSTRGGVEVVDLDAVRLILLDTTDPAIEGVGGAISAGQLEWLRSALADGRVPCLIFGHHPLDEPALEGHRYFADRPGLASVRNRADVRAVLREASTTLAVFGGHLHRTRATRIGAIPYVTIGSLIETAYTDGEPAGSYALVTVGPGAVDVSVRGTATAQFAFSRS